MIRTVHMTTVDMSVRHLLLNQLLALRSAGFDVGAVSADGPDIAPVIAAGVAHWPVPFTRRMTPVQDIRAAWRIFRLCRRERFTIVHTHQVKAALFGQAAARIAGVPIVINTVHGFYFHEHTPWLKRWAWVQLERLCARFSDVLLSQNREDMVTAVDTGICRPDQIQHLGNGIDVRRFDRADVAPEAIERVRADLGIPAGVPVIGFVGRLVREKGVSELFEAVRSVSRQHPGLRLLMVGPVDLDMPDHLGPGSADAAGIGELTVFAGYRHDLPALYAIMDVVVLPSHREGLPRVPMEASSMGVPTVATDIRGCREVVRPGRNGFLVPVRDSVALAAAIGRILDDSELADNLSRHARDLAVAEFDEQLVFDRVKATYVSLLRRKGLTPPGAAPTACLGNCPV